MRGFVSTAVSNSSVLEAEKSPLPQRETLRTHPFRLFFILLVLLGLGVIGFHVKKEYQSAYTAHVAQLQHKNAVLGEATRSSLAGLDSLLRLIGWELVSRNAIDQPENGRDFIEKLHANHLPMAGYGLARPDGQLVLISGVSVTKGLPNLLANPVTADSFWRTLNSDRIQLGPPYYMDRLSQWVIPIRVALRDLGGHVVAVMTAGLKISGEGIVWNKLNDRPGQNSLIIHEDGYVQYYGGSMTTDQELRSVYGPSGAPRAFKQAAAQDSEQTGTIVDLTGIWSPIGAPLDGKQIVSYSRLPEYGLMIFSASPYDAWLGDFFRGIAPELAGGGLLALILLGAFRYTDHQQQKHEARVAYLAWHDNLTGLPNKAQLLDRMTPMVGIARREERDCAVLVIDISSFALLNEAQGLDFGDACLIKIGQRLCDLVREGDTVARVGGDSFAVFLSSLSDSDAAVDVAAKLKFSFSQPLMVQETEVRVSAWIGLAVFPQDGLRADELVNAAALACSAAKRLQAASPIRYTAQIDTSASRRVQLESELGKALQDGLISVTYQPKRNLKTGSFDRFEALARWNSAPFGPVSPTEFVRIAEESGQIEALGDFVLNSALVDMTRLERETGKAFGVAVNISAKQFLNDDLVARVSSALAAHDFPGRRLTLEITESLMILDIDRVADMLARIRKLGVGISIDDFGTGYASLSYIHRLPITELKIDRSFVASIVEDAEGRALAKSIVALGKTLNVEVVAEGVESEEHVKILQSFGCDHLQGFYYARPAPLDQLTAGVLSSMPIDDESSDRTARGPLPHAAQKESEEA